MEENNERNDSQDTAEPTTAPIMDVQPSNDQDDLPAANEALDTAAVQPDTENKQADEPPVTETGAPDPVKQPEITASHKHSAPVVPIIIALVVAAILAVVTVMAFKNAEPTPVPTDNQTQAPAEQEEAVTAESIDQTSSEIDQAVESADETTDFPEPELSDQTLGL